MPVWLRRGAVALSLSLAVLAAAPVLSPCPVQAEAAARMTPDQLRWLGFQVMAGGEPGRALAISEALLARDPRDPIALILRSKALRALGRFGDASRAGRLAFRLSDDDPGRYGAAMATAQALASGGHRTTAQFWLRRAAQNAATPVQRRIAERDYAYVRMRNPLSLHFTFAVAPSSNVNGGSSSSTTEILGLPFLLSGDARALSGYETTLGADILLRRPARPTGGTRYRVSVQTRSYALSADARQQAPSARGSDYDYAAVEFGWSIDYHRKGSKTGYKLTAGLGHNWYGHDPLSLYANAGAALQYRLAPHTGAELSVEAEQQWRQDDPQRDARVLEARITLGHALQSGDVFRVMGGRRETESDSTSVANSAVLGEVSWTKAKPVKGVGLSAALGWEHRTYPVFPFAPGGREDDRLSARISLTLERIDYMGFSPVVNLTASQTRSNVGLYDSREAGVSFGFASSF